jgi:hypothetical protein
MRVQEAPRPESPMYSLSRASSESTPRLPLAPTALAASSPASRTSWSARDSQTSNSFHRRRVRA